MPSLRFLPPSYTEPIAYVRVSTYVGGVHEDLTSLSPNQGDASEFPDGQPIGAGHARGTAPEKTTKEQRTNKLRPVFSSTCSGLCSPRRWSDLSRRWLGSRRVLEPGAASVPGVCSGIELRVQVPPNWINKGRTRREGPFSFWGICVCSCVFGAPSLSSNLLSALSALYILAFLLVVITLPLRASLLPHLLLINTPFVECFSSSSSFPLLV